MSAGYSRIIGAQLNAMRHSLGGLVGIAQGLLCDGALSDDEIRFLRRWFAENNQLSYQFPGDVICDRVETFLADGVITEEERGHLVKVLKDLIGAPETDLVACARVTELAFDEVDRIDFPNNNFCLTGEFAHGSRMVCEVAIRQRGGKIAARVTKKLNYLVIGSLGSVEWKHGSFGTKIELAMRYKQEKLPIFVVREQLWSNAIRSAA